MKTAIKLVVSGLCLIVSACGVEQSDSPGDLESVVESASSSTWPYPVPTGCVPWSPTQCRTNVGHYDVTQAEQSLDANMAAAGFTKVYSNAWQCRTWDSYTKGSDRVCYRVGVLTDANFQSIGSQWSGFRW